ncbi:MAG TPA: MGMT family protein [Terriglobales bacterium]
MFRKVVSYRVIVFVFGMNKQILDVIRRIPRGKVSTYGAVARAAGYPRGARMVARALHGGFDVPWQRVLGAGGEIKLRGDWAFEQRFRLQAEGVVFRGRKVDMKLHEHKFPKKVRVRTGKPKKSTR